MPAFGSRPLVAVIATGGTIASKRNNDGAAVPMLGGDELAAMLPDLPIALRAIDLMAKDSSSLTLLDMQTISDAVGTQLADCRIDGIVVLHGTDAMEETSFLVGLQHRLTKPVIFTGAQFSADDTRSDGPDNLTSAIKASLDPINAERGVLVAFGRRLLPVYGIYKHSADQADAFALVDANAPALPYLPAPIGTQRVDIVAIFPGCDATHIEASVAAGASGLVLAALGSGNANAAIVGAVARCVDRGLPVVVSSRVPQGYLTPVYGGGGGGHDLAAAGAIYSPMLRPSQARILLASLIAGGDDVAGGFAEGQ